MKTPGMKMSASGPDKRCLSRPDPLASPSQPTAGFGRCLSAQTPKIRNVVKEPRRTQCPSCRSDNVAEIVYGLVSLDQELNEALERGRVVLGGCEVTDHDPKWHCNACGAEFRSSGPDARGPKPRASS
jgi:hypothetical protein